MEGILERQLKLFERHAVLLCEAGISVNSGLPSVLPLTRSLLKKLGAADGDIKIFTDSGFPFEAMMEVLKTRLNIFSVLDLFNVENPNQNHRLIAFLAKKGYLKIIVTTNFDRNIEISLCDLGLKENTDFTVVSDLDKINHDLFTNKLVVLKLHGSVENHHSIQSTITRVANKANQEKMINTFNLLFASTAFFDLITWGYSFSDHYDIKPALKKLAPSDKNIYSIRYQGKRIKEKIIDNSGDQLFERFLSATDWCCSLDKIVEKTSLHVGLPIVACDKLTWKTKLANIIKTGIHGKGLNNKYGTLAALFQTAGHTEIARKYAEAGLLKSKKRDHLLRMDLIAAIGKAYLRDPNNRDVEKALSFLEEAKMLAIKLDLKDYVRIFSADIASCYNMLHRYKEAEEPYRAIIDHYKSFLTDPDKKDDARDKISGYQTMLAHCIQYQDKFSDALDLYTETLSICRAHGLVANLELALAGYGIALCRSGQPEKGLACFEEGYPLAVLNGSADRIKSQFYLLCSWTWTVNGKWAAKKIYRKEYDFVHAKTGMEKTLDQIGKNLLGSVK